MAGEIKISFDKELTQFLRSKKSSGAYRSAHDFIRHLVRREYEHEQRQNSMWFRSQLKSGAGASDDDFIPIDAEGIMAEAKRRLKGRDG